MWTIRLRIGAPEALTLVSILAAVGLSATAIAYDWTFALVPGMTYLLASVGAYVLYGQLARERAQAQEAAAGVISFRVVETRGVCPLGHQTGDVVSVGAGGAVSPVLCHEAETVLALAAGSTEGEPAKEWCCPVYEHMLVFRRETAAA
jgi:hypothetical protein